LLLMLMRRASPPVPEALVGVFCYFVTFFLIGIWHGRTPQFVIFGLLAGAGVSINKLWQLGLDRVLGRARHKELARRPLYELFGRGLNFVWFSFMLLWFWADPKQIHAIFTALRLIQWLVIWLGALLIASLSLALWEWLRAVLLSVTTSEGPIVTSRYARVVYASALGLVAIVSTVLLNQPAPEIVYKAF
jgi:alginate O-acetyltransferase complex protein AlgI